MIETSFCFSLGSLTGADVVHLVKATLPFEPTHIVMFDELRGRPRFREQEHLEMISTRAEVPSLVLDTPRERDGEYFELKTIAAWNMQVAYWYYETPESLPIEKLHEVSQMPGFTAGYTSDRDDTFWQSMTIPETYKIFGKTPPALFKDSTGLWYVDISGNPARRTLFDSMWLQVAWRMWLGKLLQSISPADGLSQMEDVHSCVQLSESTLFVQLTEQIEDFASEPARDLQRRVRHALSFDYLESVAKDFASDDSAAGFTIEDGNFESGGIRRVTTFLDSSGRPTARPWVRRRVVVVQDARGVVVMRAEEEL